MIKLKNDKERMDFIKNNDNWESKEVMVLYQMEVKVLNVGQRQFVRIIGNLKGEYDPKPKESTIEQFEVLRKGDDKYLEHRSNGEIVKAIRECRNV